MSTTNYSAPTLEELGTFEKLTQASGCPDALDAMFPAGTPFGELTCGPEDGLSYTTSAGGGARGGGVAPRTALSPATFCKSYRRCPFAGSPTHKGVHHGQT
jgi:hypothetical protein